MKKQSMRGGLTLLFCAALCLAVMIGGCAKQPEAPSGSAAVPEASEKVPELGEEELEHMLPILVAYRNGEQGQEAVWQEGGDLSVSKALMEQYAAVCFEGFAQLPEVPESVEQVVYEQSTGKYLLKNTDQSEIYGKIYAVQETAQGIYRVSLNLFAGDDDLPYEQYEFILVDNKNKSEAAPSFDYCVRQANKFEMNPGSMAR